jgi:hypothetical protein
MIQREKTTITGIPFKGHTSTKVGELLSLLWVSYPSDGLQTERANIHGGSKDDVITAKTASPVTPMPRPVLYGKPNLDQVKGR